MVSPEIFGAAVAVGGAAGIAFGARRLRRHHRPEEPRVESSPTPLKDCGRGNHEFKQLDGGVFSCLRCGKTKQRTMLRFEK
jgi:hypothetical protein